MLHTKKMWFFITAMLLIFLSGCGKDNQKTEPIPENAETATEEVVTTESAAQNIGETETMELEESAAVYLQQLSFDADKITKLDLDAAESVTAPEITINYEKVTIDCRDQILSDYYIFSEEEKTSDGSFCEVSAEWFAADETVLLKQTLFLYLGGGLYQAQVEQALVGKTVGEYVLLSMDDVSDIPSAPAEATCLRLTVTDIRHYEPGPNVKDLENEGIYSVEDAYRYLFNMRVGEQTGVATEIANREWLRQMEQAAEYFLTEQSIREYAYLLITEETDALEKYGITTDLENSVDSEEAQQLISSYVDYAEYKAKEILLIGALANQYGITTSESELPTGGENNSYSVKELAKIRYDKTKAKVLEHLRVLQKN